MSILDLIDQHATSLNDGGTPQAETQPVETRSEMAPLQGRWFWRSGIEYTNDHKCKHAVTPSKRGDTVKVVTTITCGRCDGRGTYSYCPRYGRMCFKCSGAGKVRHSGNLYTADRLAALNDQKARAEARKQVKAAQAKLDAAARIRQQFPEWTDWEATFQQGSFGYSVMRSIIERGTYTDRQIGALRKCYETEKRSQQRQAQWAKENQASQHVGTVGQRTQFKLTIKATSDYDNGYGEATWHLLVDADGNQLIYSGTAYLGERGDTIELTATIKDHKVESRDGTHRTVLNRPRVMQAA